MRSSLPTTSATTDDWMSHEDQDLEEVILSLPTLLSSLTRLASHAIGSSSDKVTGVSGTVPVGLKLEALALRDPTLASELLFGLLLRADVNELPSVSRREMRRGVVDCLIRAC